MGMSGGFGFGPGTWGVGCGGYQDVLGAEVREGLRNDDSCAKVAAHVVADLQEVGRLVPVIKLCRGRRGQIRQRYWHRREFRV